MQEYLGTSFAVPTILAFVGFAAWVVVVGRMTNVGFPAWKRLLTFLWALTVLLMGIVDLVREHFYRNEVCALTNILLKTSVRAGIIVLAVVRYREIAKTHKEALAACPYEPSFTPEQRSILCKNSYGVSEVQQ